MDQAWPFTNKDKDSKYDNEEINKNKHGLDVPAILSTSEDLATWIRNDSKWPRLCRLQSVLLQVS